MTITVTFNTDHLDLTPGTEEHAKQVLESYLRGKGVVKEHEENGKYVWGWERLEAKQEEV